MADIRPIVPTWLEPRIGAMSLPLVVERGVGTLFVRDCDGWTWAWFDLPQDSDRFTDAEWEHYEQVVKDLVMLRYAQ